MGNDDIDRIVQRICSKILADMLLAVPLEVRGLVQLDVLEMIGMAVVEGKTSLVLVERAGVAPSGFLMVDRRVDETTKTKHYIKYPVRT